MLGTLAPFLFQRPAASGVDDLVNLGHEADGFVKCHDDAVVMDKVFESEVILAINEDYLLCC